MGAGAKRQKGLRGLTLLEVLLAAALLSVATLAILPFLKEGLAVLRAEPEPDPSALAALADAFLQDSCAFGFEELPEQADLAWLKSSGLEAVRVMRLDPVSSEKPHHQWFLFQAGEFLVVRWHREEESSAPGAKIEAGPP
ncbi:MAG: prepilin-type N-terminal cleavage/methylation domain-containing protein [Planctomycetota bacterium]